MRKTFLITLLIASYFAKAQTNNSDSTSQTKTNVPGSASDNRVFTAVERQPDFPGGINAFYTYLGQNIIYPPNAAINRIQGRVFVGFVVEKDGILSDIKILRGVSSEIDSEAIRVVARSPRWLPGMVNGRQVRAQYTVVIAFKLPAPESKEQAFMDSVRQLPPDKKIFTAVEIEPSFPGGIAAFYKFTQQSIQYPPDAAKNRIQGRVYLSFIVERDGSLSEIKIARGVSEDLNAEALRLINTSPKWNPGIQNGRTVRVTYTIPVIFTLAGE